MGSLCVKELEKEKKRYEARIIDEQYFQDFLEERCTKTT